MFDNTDEKNKKMSDLLWDLLSNQSQICKMAEIWPAVSVAVERLFGWDMSVELQCSMLYPLLSVVCCSV